MNGRYHYVVLGAGKQGVAAAYDALLFGHASKLLLADQSLPAAIAGVERLKKLCGPALHKNAAQIIPYAIDGRSGERLRKAIQGSHVVLSALPYYLNFKAAVAAIACGVHYCDLGGYFESTQKIMKLDKRARKAGVILTPDCGVSPGMCNSLALCALETLDETSDIQMYCGGLPQKPRPPLGYKVVFNLEGVLGNYFGKAYVLENGKVRLVPSFSGREAVHLGPPLGVLEAVVTGGATSTCPWTFRGKIKNYSYKTLRYPGHYDKIQALKDLGLLDTEPVKLNGQMIVPREFFVALAEPKLRFPDDKDLLVMRVVATGTLEGRKTEIIYDVLEYFDAKTGLTAMQRTTGFSAAVIMEELAGGRVPEAGFVPVEKVMSGRSFLREIRRRGIQIKETVRNIEQTPHKAAA